MSDTSIRRSPIHHLLEPLQPVWGLAGATPIAVRFETEETETAAMQTLGLCDLSGPAKLGLKGRDSLRRLSEQSVDVPAAVYESRRLADGGLIVRLGEDEFLLESGIADESVPALAAGLDWNQGHLFRVEREEATFLLVGTRALDVLAQTCGIDFREAAPQRLILTRVAGVSCGVLPDSAGDTPAYRFWVDYTYAVALWETLLQICKDLDGRVIGAACLFPELGRFYPKAE